LSTKEEHQYAKKIKEQAYNLGFSLCGITTPESPLHLEEYHKWLSDGLHADMEYMGNDRARHMRANPKDIFPECKSILVVASNYYQGEFLHPSSDAISGKVARYAWGKDYHTVMKHRLQELMGFVESVSGKPVRYRLYVDTGPLLERELAQRAGLGWIGKNTMLINHNIGSWTLLAEAMLDIWLPPDEPYIVDRCGSCTFCIDACPTDAIMSDPRRIDSNKCISYLTIEHRGAINSDRRSDLDDWVFGCDICQDVCPWNNRFAMVEHDVDFAPVYPLPHLDLHNLLQMDQSEFSRTFSGSPVKRTKRSGLIRNASVALGNHGDDKSIHALANSLSEDPDPIIRAHSAWALGKIGDIKAVNLLNCACDNEDDVDVLVEIKAALEELSNQKKKQ
tara:strand:+ start:5244 stop:6419 length:1176 start_codon:yes stop_codon:yes gene_type:complete